MPENVPHDLREFLELEERDRRLGPFMLRRQLGRGGFAPVWLAEEQHDRVTLRTAAVKLFSFARDGAPSDRQRRQLVLEEARALCTVTHPNVVTFYQLVTDEARGVLGLAMEYVEGTSLDRWIAAQSAAGAGGSSALIDATIRIGIAIASALAAVHRAGLVHRDVKPANVIEAKGVYKLIDFGIVAADRPSLVPPAARRRSIVVGDVPIEAGGTRVTALLTAAEGQADAESAGAAHTMPFAIGTVGYVDPVHMRNVGESSTPSSDLYSLGVLLFECLTFELPSVAAYRLHHRAPAGPALMKAEVLTGKERAPFIAPLVPQTPPSLANLIDGLLDPDPARRPASAEEVVAELERIRIERLARDATAPSSMDVALAGARGRRTKIAIAAFVLVSAIVGGLYVIDRRTTQATDEKVSSGWADATRCLLGAPLADGERASVRFHRVAMAAARTNEGELRVSGSGDPWPRGCAPSVQALFMTLSSSARSKREGGDLAAQLDKTRTLLLEHASEADLPSIGASIDALFELAPKEVPDLRRASTAWSPPAPRVARFDLDVLRASKPLATYALPLQTVFDEEHRTPALRLVLNGLAPDVPRVCTFDDAGAHCTNVPEGVARTGGTVRLKGKSAPAEPLLLFVGPLGGSGVFRADTGASVSTFALNVTGSLAEGDVLTLIGGDRSAYELEMMRATPDGKSAFGFPSDVLPTYPVATIGTDVLWVEPTEDGEPQLYVESMDAKDAKDANDAAPKEPTAPTAAPSAPAQKPKKSARARLLGEAPYPTAYDDDVPPWTSCETPQMIAVRLHGDSSDVVTFRVGSVWSPPKVLREGNARMTCSGDAAIFSGYQRERCTAAQGCVGADIDEVYGGVDLDSAIVQVVRDADGLQLRTRTKEGTPVSDAFLFDPRILDGAMADDARSPPWSLWSRPGIAVLLLSTAKGTYAIRIGADGTTKALDLAP